MNSANILGIFGLILISFSCGQKQTHTTKLDNHSGPHEGYCVEILPLKGNLYLNIDNLVECGAYGLNGDNISVQTSNGTVTRERAGLYSITPVSIEPAIIEVLINDSVVRSVQYSVTEIPTVKPHISGFNDNSISKLEILNLESLDVEIPYYLDFYQVRIKSFTVVAYINGTRKEVISSSNEFTQQQIDLIRTLSPGEIFYIEEITATISEKLKQDLEILKVEII